MRAAMCAATMACVLSGAAQAEVITSTSIISPSVVALQADMASYKLTPFNQALGTLTNASVTFSGTLNTGAQPIRAFQGETLPTTVSLESFVGLFLFGPNSPTQALPIKIAQVVGSTALPVSSPFTVSGDLPLSPSFQAEPELRVRGFTRVSSAGGGSLDNSITFDTTTLIGALTVAYTFTPAAVPEPVSLSLLGLGLVGLAVARRRATPARWLK